MIAIVIVRVVVVTVVVVVVIMFYWIFGHHRTLNKSTKYEPNFP